MAPRVVSVWAAMLDIRLLWVLIGAVVVRALSRRYLTSLRGIPGPFLASFSSLWQVYYLFQGHTEEEIIKLHKKHGVLSSPGMIHLGNSHVVVEQGILCALQKTRLACLILRQSRNFFTPT